MAESRHSRKLKISMEYVATSSPKLVDEVSEILESTGEIAVLIWFHASAGARSYEFFESSESFFDRVADLPPRASVLIFRTPQFPIRGVTDDSLVDRAKAAIPDGSDWTVVRTSLITMGSQSWFHHVDDNSHAKLENELRNDFCWGHPVAIGIEPDWRDPKIALSALKPHEDGRIEPGIY